MQATATRANHRGDLSPDIVRAFRDLHGERLHGFALLVTLGDRPRAARLAGEALAAGAAQAAELRHPERAAAWLRRRVARVVGRDRRLVGRRASGNGEMALVVLGADGPVFAGLSALTTRERAALVADSVERLDRRDVATIVGVDGTRLERLIRRARSRYAATVAAELAAAHADAGPTAERIRAIARRALA